MAEHTPGPWRVFKTPGGVVYIVDAADQKLLGTVYSLEGGRKNEARRAEAAANADLLAAAPDLLAACEELLEVGVDGPTRGAIPRTVDELLAYRTAAGDRARAAIAKAKGDAE